MNILNLLIPKEKIVGIEIGSRKLRMLSLREDSFGNITAQGASEVDLEEGVIDFGVVKDKKKLSEALAQLKKTFTSPKALSPFAIVAVSQNGIYSDVLEFPKNLNNDQLVAAVSFNAATSLPMPLSECYFDWQVVEKGESKDKVLISIISKEIADTYIEVLKDNGFKLIALEPVSLAIGRAAQIPKEPVLFFYLSNDGVTSIIYNNNSVYLSQFNVWREVSGGEPVKNFSGLSRALKIKIKSLAHYFESQYNGGKIKKVLLMGEGFDADAIVKGVVLEDMILEKVKPNISSIKDYGWLAVGGAAKRAFIPRSEDTVISLLPVGTEGLYESQKEISFLKSMRVLVATIAMFYVGVFVAVFLFVSYLNNDIGKQMEIRGKLPLPADYSKIEQETVEFNNYINDLGSFYAKTDVDHSAILEKINELNALGILLTSVSFRDAKGSINVTSIALSRDQLNAFKNQMLNSASFTNVKFSVNNIAQKNNIPFSVNFSLK